MKATLTTFSAVDRALIAVAALVVCYQLAFNVFVFQTEQDRQASSSASVAAGFAVLPLDEKINRLWPASQQSTAASGAAAATEAQQSTQDTVSLGNSSVKLVAIASTGTQSRLASFYIQSEQSSGFQTVAVGQTVLSFTVVSIATDEACIEDSSKKLCLSILKKVKK